MQKERVAAGRRNEVQVRTDGHAGDGPIMPRQGVERLRADGRIIGAAAPERVDGPDHQRAVERGRHEPAPACFLRTVVVVVVVLLLLLLRRLRSEPALACPHLGDCPEDLTAL